MSSGTFSVAALLDSSSSVVARTDSDQNRTAKSRIKPADFFISILSLNHSGLLHNADVLNLDAHQTEIVSPIFMTRNSAFTPRFFNSRSNSSGVPVKTGTVP